MWCRASASVSGFALGFDLPVVVYQRGDDDGATRAVAHRTPPQQALGDSRFKPKAISFRNGPLGGFGLSTLLGSPRRQGNTASYLGEGKSTGELRMLAEYKLIAVALQGTAGFRLRFDERDVLRRTYNHEVPWGVAISFRPQALGWDDKGRFTWVAEVHGAGMVPPSQAAGIAARGRPSRRSWPDSRRLRAFRRLFSSRRRDVAQPSLRGPPIQVLASLGWAPRKHDADDDGVKDDVDQCPSLQRTGTAFRMRTVAPTGTTTMTASGDTEDKCPTQQEDTDGFETQTVVPIRTTTRTASSTPRTRARMKRRAKRRIRRSTAARQGQGWRCRQGRQVPDQPEDVDGFEDADGCPDRTTTKTAFRRDRRVP